ncbi:hypothetical protein WG66_013903 [Moniliophthora roreri]|nr:hypothetical protein WG66_013903 [Moniliophthora roreri]
MKLLSIPMISTQHLFCRSDAPGFRNFSQKGRPVVVDVGKPRLGVPSLLWLLIISHSHGIDPNAIVHTYCR